MVLLDMAVRLRPSVPVFYLDTGFLFPETRALVRQADGNWFLGLFVAKGRVADHAEMRLRSGLRAAVTRYGCDVRLTAQQNILLTGIAPACPALPTCGLAVAEAERVLPDLLERITAELQPLGLADEPISIRMTGCPNGCARSYMGDIGIVGRSKGLYAVFLGGDQPNTRLNTLYAETVAFDDIPALLRPLFVIWQRERRPGEHFGDFCTRRGIDSLRALAVLQPTSQPPTARMTRKIYSTTSSWMNWASRR
jgi:sulfite reductase (ferredoxin)